MGISPAEVSRMSLWEFNCAYNGWLLAQGAKPEDEALDDAAHLAMVEEFEARERAARV